MKMNNSIKIAAVAAISIFSFSCNKDEKKEDTSENAEVASVIEEVRAEFVPDKRVALFDVETSERDGKTVVRGDSNFPEAVESLRAKLAAQNIEYIDSIKILPEGEIKATPKALVKISVANLRSNPKHSAELATQAMLGTPLNVLKKEDGWYLVQTPDKYLAWVDAGGIQLTNESEFSTWQKAPKMIFTNTFGASYSKASDGSQVVSDLVAGNVLELIKEQNNFYEVKYPSGDTAFVKKNEMKTYSDWVKSLNATEENLVSTSKSLMGLPYLWGGTSAKGVDCSGFTKTVYFLNGIVLPRDASQQIHTGTFIDSTRNFEKLIPGDLLFFGRKATDTTAERVVHVGMWIGNNQFIHAMGNVHISTVDTTNADFDEYNYNRYLRTNRITKETTENLTRLAESNMYENRNEQ